MRRELTVVLAAAVPAGCSDRAERIANVLAPCIRAHTDQFVAR